MDTYTCKTANGNEGWVKNELRQFNVSEQKRWDVHFYHFQPNEHSWKKHTHTLAFVCAKTFLRNVWFRRNELNFSTRVRIVLHDQL